MAKRKKPTVRLDERGLRLYELMYGKSAVSMTKASYP